MEHIVFEVGLALTLVAGAALLSARLRFSVVPFLILAGMVVGPPMPKLGIVDLWFIQSAPLIEFMGWLGILFLLFYLGLEFSLGRLVKAGRLIVVGGTIYIALNFGLGLGNDDDIGGFAALDTFHGRAGSGERDCELVSGRALELRPEVFHDRLHPDGAQHFELSGLRLDAEHKQKSERIFMASSCEMANLRA
jgi:hypothetical protein